MKKYVGFIALTLLSHAALAHTANTAKQLQVPFVNQSINAADHEGLSVAYNMNQNPAQQVVCTFAHVYKGWVDYSENKVMQASNTYGGEQTVIFTNKGQTGYITETLDQFHADAAGSLMIHDNTQQSGGFVSCFYMMDQNSNK